VKLTRQLKHKLHDRCSHNQAEQMAIVKALQEIESIQINNNIPKTIIIHTDSRITLDFLKNMKNRNYLQRVHLLSCLDPILYVAQAVTLIATAFCPHTHACTRTHARTHTHTHAHIHTRTYTHIHINTDLSYWTMQLVSAKTETRQQITCSTSAPHFKHTENC
jgi:hypothetical protein